MRPARIQIPFDHDVPRPGGDDTVFVFGPDRAFDPGPLVDANLVCFTPDKVVWGQLAAAGRTVAETPVGECQIALVYLPRNRVQGLGWIATALDCLRPDGWLIVDGTRANGADATLKRLTKTLPNCTVAARDHGKVAWVRRPQQLPDAVADWSAAAQPSRNRDGYLTAPGMFSQDGLDPGTRLLADTLPRDLSGAAVDLGAGWGGLSACLLAAAPGLERLDLVESDRPSIEAAQSNITDPRARFHWADATTWDCGPYDLVVANPPFHLTRRSDPGLGVAFIAAAARLVAAKGQFLMVANRQLPYERALDQAFAEWSEIRSDKTYKILTAKRPRKGRRARAG